MKPSIYFYSDCPFFAGCENMLANFFNDDSLAGRYRITFVYRYSARYESGFRERVKKVVDSVPLKLLNIGDYTGDIAFKPARLAIKTVFSLFLVKYWFILWNTIVLYRVFRKEGIGLLHINNGGYPGAYSCMSAVFAARLAGIKRVVYVVNNVAFSYRSFRRWLDYPLDRFVAGTVSVFITGSEYARARLVHVLRLPFGKALSIHNGIQPRAVTEGREEVLRRLGVEQGRLLIVAVAVLEERKGHVYLLKAVQRLIGQGYGAGITVIIEGSGTLLESLKAFVIEAGLSENVRFIGNEANVFNLLNAADVVVLPSIADEDFPNVVIEAMCLGKVVIASRISGTPEQIAHMESGILVEPMDVHGLADAVRLVADDEHLRNRLGRNAADRFREKFSAKAAVEKYCKLYDNLFNQRPT